MLVNGPLNVTDDHGQRKDRLGVGILWIRLIQPGESISFKIIVSRVVGDREIESCIEEGTAGLTWVQTLRLHRDTPDC